MVDENQNVLARLQRNDPWLVAVDLSNTALGDKGAVAVAEALQCSEFLSFLDLRNANIGDKGAIALARVLAKNSTLVSLNLAKNSIGRPGGEALADALRSNCILASLNLEQNPSVAALAGAFTEAVRLNHTICFVGGVHLIWRPTRLAVPRCTMGCAADPSRCRLCAPQWPTVWTSRT